MKRMPVSNNSISIGDLITTKVDKGKSRRSSMSSWENSRYSDNRSSTLMIIRHSWLQFRKRHDKGLSRGKRVGNSTRSSWLRTTRSRPPSFSACWGTLNTAPISSSNLNLRTQMTGSTCSTRAFLKIWSPLLISSKWKRWLKIWFEVRFYRWSIVRML